MSAQLQEGAMERVLEKQWPASACPAIVFLVLCNGLWANVIATRSGLFQLQPRIGACLFLHTYTNLQETPPTASLSTSPSLLRFTPLFFGSYSSCSQHPLIMWRKRSISIAPISSSNRLTRYKMTDSYMKPHIRSDWLPN